MIQTSYVPLEHPYRVIEYNGTLGIQIGTLIVTKDISEGQEGCYAIETHSHPVVSYVNIHHIHKEHKAFVFFHYDEVEGVVWDKVELKQVKTLMRLGDLLEWSRFMDFCRKWILEELYLNSLSSTLKIVDAWGKISDWGIEIRKPVLNSRNEAVLSVELYDHIEGAKAYCLGRGDMGIAAPSVRTERMLEVISSQTNFYRSFVIRQWELRDVKVVYSTKESRYKDLAEKLNERFSGGYGYEGVDDKWEMPMAAEGGTDDKV